MSNDHEITQNSPIASPAITPAEPKAHEVKAADRLGLEDIVHLANKIGLEYVAAKKEADRLDLLKPTVRARVMIRLDNGDMTESLLRRVTEVDPEYTQFLEQLAAARGEADRLRIRYESYKNLFEARRSLLSYQKAELKLI